MPSHAERIAKLTDDVRGISSKAAAEWPREDNVSAPLTEREMKVWKILVHTPLAQKHKFGYIAGSKRNVAQIPRGKLSAAKTLIDAGVTLGYFVGKIYEKLQKARKE